MADAKTVESSSEDEVTQRIRCPEENANFFSRVFLAWVFPFVHKGWKKPLADEDLWELRDHERGSYTTNRLLSAFKAESELGKSKKPMTTALYRNYRKEFLGTAVLKGLTVALYLVNPILLNNLIQYTQARRSSNPPPISTGLGWAFSLLLTPIVFTIIENHYFLRTFRTGMCVRSAMQGVIYDKSLRMSPSARAGSSVGEIVNLMQMDSQRVGDFAQIAHILWSAPIQLIVSLALLFKYIGWSAAIGLVATLLTLPLQGKLMAVQMRLRKESVGITDVRVKLMNEILQGIKAVKFYAWEKPFSDQVEKEREAEVDNFSKTIWARSLFFSIMLSIPTLIAVVTFAFYAGVFKKPLDPARIFTSITLLNILRQPVLMLPFTVTALIDARLGLKRIDRFIHLEDTDDYARKVDADSESRSESIDDSDESDTQKNVKENETKLQQPKTGRGEIVIEKASFRWGEPGPPLTDPAGAKKKFNLNCFKRKSGDDDSSTEIEPDDDSDENEKSKVKSNILENVSLHLAPGKLTAVIGRVGAGKSSLVAAILGEMQKTSGSVSLKGQVAYVAQTAWIFNDTLRNNILFGNKFDEKLYRRAIRVSVLGPDIDVLPAGDQTAIGEKGINLSGGQKQRVSIARAVYADADVYIFDDPLSALDAHVSQTVFDKCISNKGVLRNRLRLLITNQVQVLPDCNRIVLLENGRIRNQGTYRELSSSDSAFQEIVNEKKGSRQNEEGDVQQDPSRADTSEIPIESVSISVGQDDKGSIAASNLEDAAEKAGTKLIQEEDRSVGNILLGAYYQYAKACGGIVVFCLCMLFWALVVALGLLSPVWLAFWSDSEQSATKSGNPDPRSLGFYIGIYFLLGIGYAVLTTLRSVWYLTMALYAGKRLHEDALAFVLHAPMSFFDTTPIGRILSRFSRDVAAVDQLLPQAFSQMLTTVMSLIGTYIIIARYLPPFLGIATPVTFCYWLLQRFFNRTSLEVKRLDSISKSPIYAHFSETLSGLSTLRAYNKQELAKMQNRSMIDVNHRAYFAYVVASRWFSIYLELMGSSLIFFTALFAVTIPGASSSAEIGLSLSYAIQVTSILGFSVRSITELEAQMNAVERLDYYATKLPQEAATVVDYKELAKDDRPPQNWPSDGAVDIKDVELRYREGLDLVLKGVSVSIKGGEKVGVIGRTGSGKSTMMVAFLRLVELTGGSINVDGVNLANLGLDHIRKSITIIPQDSVLFSGSVRFNLDPFGIYSEPQLWDALEKSHLKEFVKDFEGGLDARVSEYGENLSAGQRQLICLTRALLRNSKILILDEASSSLDMETDRLIQETIRKHLKDATILTIAHRLFTLADYDKILVMDNGVVAEYGSPAELLSDNDSKFSGFVNSLGANGAEQFRIMVERSKQG